MAELILSQEEKDALSYFDWDDASLGKLVKKVGSLMLPQHEHDKLTTTSCALMLCSFAKDNNSFHTTINLDDVTSGDENIGNWVVEVYRVSDSQVKESKNATN